MSYEEFSRQFTVAKLSPNTPSQPHFVPTLELTGKAELPISASTAREDGKPFKFGANQKLKTEDKVQEVMAKSVKAVNECQRDQVSA